MSRFLAGTSFDRAQKVVKKYPEDENMKGLSDQLEVALKAYHTLREKLKVGEGTTETPELTGCMLEIRDISRQILETASKIDTDQKLFNVQSQLVIFAVIATLFSGFAAWIGCRQATAAEKANVIAEKAFQFEQEEAKKKSESQLAPPNKPSKKKP